MASNQAEELARAFHHAFDAYRRLLAAARAMPSDDLSSLRDLVDPNMLVELVKNRILPGKAFEALLAIDQERALHVLFQRFIGDINPDRCYGGFTYDLSSMLRHLRSTTGDEGIRGILNNPSFNRTMLSDIRFLQAVADALDIDESDAPSWLQQNGLQTHE